MRLHLTTVIFFTLLTSITLSTKLAAAELERKKDSEKEQKLRRDRHTYELDLERLSKLPEDVLELIASHALAPNGPIDKNAVYKRVKTVTLPSCANGAATIIRHTT